MLFINISSDQVIIQGKNIDLLVPYDDLERKLPEIIGELYNTQPFKTVWTLNGPGGFTILRIGCLAINTMQMALEGKLRFYSCTKLDLYGSLIKKGFLPPTGIIFIGQRKNMRWATLDTETGVRDTQILPASSLDHMTKSGEYFVDVMYDHPLKEKIDLEKMISLKFEDEQLHISRQKNTTSISTDDLGLMLLTYLQPEYMMQPEITPHGLMM